MLVQNNFVDYFVICLTILGKYFLSDVEYLPFFPPCVTILVYNCDDLGTKSVSLTVYQAIHSNSENIES